jgi:glycosyltransferase involved in cell wall biosynthesis
MKILHITPYYYPAMGGAEVQAKEICERLARRGHDVTVMTMNPRGTSDGGDDLKAVEVLNGVTVSRFRPADKVHDLFNGLLGLRGAHRLLGLAVGEDRIQMLAIGPCSLSAFRLIARLKPEVVAVSNWYCGALAYQACLARRLWTFALVGIPLFHTERDWSRSSLYAGMLERCDAVLALTEHERTFIEQRCARDNVHVVGVGVDPTMFRNADRGRIRDRYGIGDAPLVGYVGRMTAVKGVAILIEAMKIVWRTDSRVRLLLAGAGLPTGAGGQDDIARTLAGLSEAERSRIIIVGGFTDGEKAAIFDALDVFAMPSIAESFGIAYLEAWVCRKPVIGSRIGSTQCVIENGVDGLLVEPENPEDLAGAIRRLLSNRPLREQMGRAGCSKTISRFTWDAITDKVEHIYHQLEMTIVDQRPAGPVKKPWRRQHSHRG